MAAMTESTAVLLVNTIPKAHTEIANIVYVGPDFITRKLGGVEEGGGEGILVNELEMERRDEMRRERRFLQSLGVK